MNIGITGANGVLGRIFTRKIQENGHTPHCFQGDIRLKDHIRQWLSEKPVDRVVHLAAMVPTRQVEENRVDAYDVNVGGTINLLGVLQELGYPVWLFYASTCHVYKSKQGPITEDDPIDPVSFYGTTKYLGEKICRDVADDTGPKNNISFCCGRLFSFYHPTQQKPFLYPTIIERLQTEDLSQPFTVYNANAKRDISNAETIADSMIKMTENKLCGTFNVGSGRATSIQDFVREISPHPLTFTPAEPSNEMLVADISKLNKALYG
jgi:UDP-glucose 4-epimerase